MDNPEKLAAYGTQDEDKQNKNTTQIDNMCWTPLSANKHKKINKMCALLQTTGGKDEPNIIFTWPVVTQKFMISIVSVLICYFSFSDF